MEKLIQVRIDEDVKSKADKIFEHAGLSTQQALKIFLTQIAQTGQTPFDGVFFSHKD